MKKLDGYKTYIVVIAMIITVILFGTGHIDENTFNMLSSLYVALIGFSLRDAIKKK